MKLYTYIVARDYGFAPNPYNGYCTLACCKGPVRGGAVVGDWVIGTGSKARKMAKTLVCAMRVAETMGFDAYWNDPRFTCKQPVMNGSNKRMCGDNIYHRNPLTGTWIQEDSHHSNDNGAVNLVNLTRDTRYDKVLVATEFYYFGGNAVPIPQQFHEDFCCKNQGQKKITNGVKIAEFLVWLNGLGDPGYRSDPYLLNKFKRFKG